MIVTPFLYLNGSEGAFAAPVGSCGSVDPLVDPEEPWSELVEFLFDELDADDWLDEDLFADDDPDLPPA
ncbi:MAG: hypothetical protein ABI137_09075 [Antricoccus sp.]